jgi:hypothetical protein
MLRIATATFIALMFNQMIQCAGADDFIDPLKPPFANYDEAFSSHVLAELGEAIKEGEALAPNFPRMTESEGIDPSTISEGRFAEIRLAWEREKLMYMLTAVRAQLIAKRAVPKSRVWSLIERIPAPCDVKETSSATPPSSLEVGKAVVHRFGCGTAAVGGGFKLWQAHNAARHGDVSVADVSKTFRKYGVSKPKSQRFASDWIKAIKRRPAGIAGLGLMVWGAYDMYFGGSSSAPSDHVGPGPLGSSLDCNSKSADSKMCFDLELSDAEDKARIAVEPVH